MGAHGDDFVGKRVEAALGARARQQVVVAELGLKALANDDLRSLMDEAVVRVARTLGVEHAKIVEVLPGGEELLLRAGVGWREGLVGRAKEDAGCGSQAGYTLLSDEPVVADDVRAEARFRPSPLLVEHAVVSSVTVVIPGHLGPYGVLGVHTSERRVFSEDDVNFLQAVANVLAAAIERERSEEAVGEIREAERARVARDLHDGALQDLAYGLAEVHVAEMYLRNAGSGVRCRRARSGVLGPQARERGTARHCQRPAPCGGTGPLPPKAGRVASGADAQDGPGPRHTPGGAGGVPFGARRRRRGGSLARGRGGPDERQAPLGGAQRPG
jgi:GAF domain/Histidine kinase